MIEPDRTILACEIRKARVTRSSSGPSGGAAPMGDSQSGRRRELCCATRHQCGQRVSTAFHASIQGRVEAPCWENGTHDGAGPVSYR